MQPTSPPPRSTTSKTLRRYAPFLAIVVVVVVVLVLVGGGKGGNGTSKTTSSSSTAGVKVPTNAFVAMKDGTESSVQWQAHCDTKRGQVAMPAIGAAPCVPAFSGDNGGATTAGVTGDTIRIGYYVAKEDPQQTALLKLAGAYDPPDKVQAARQDYVQIYQHLYETYGRKVQLVKLEASGAATDSTAARADAIRAVNDHLFAVIGGPSQTKAFAETLASHQVLCIGTCLLAQPQSFFQQHQPYIWTGSPSPEQTQSHTVEFIEKQLKGKDAVYAGDPAMQKEPRKFGMLTYDTPDGNYKPSWDNFAKLLKQAGIPVAARVTYFLDLTKAQENARTIIAKLKSSGVTTVIFSGDPIMPQYFTKEATAQGYFPEWLISGTVLADTTVLARPYDQKQWAHAFGISLPVVRTPQKEGSAYQLHEWWFGTPPPSDNSYAITQGDVALLFAGIQTAGADLTPQTFAAGLEGIPVPPDGAGPNGLRAITTWGKHGIWPGNDPMGLDNATLIWWDPTAKGPDETGTEGTGMYRYVDGGRRYLPGHWPTTPIKLFDPKGTVTVYQHIPADLKPPTYPVPADAPAANKG